MIRSRLAVLAALTLTAGVAHAQDGVAFDAKVLAMTPEGFAARVIVEDDGLESEAVLSTQFTSRKKSRRGIDDRAHLRAVVDKASGAVRYEVRQALRYSGEPRAYRSVRYLTPSGLRQVPLSEVRDGIVDCAASDYAMPVCHRTAYLSFSVDEAELASIAGGEPGVFRFRFESGDGNEHSSGLVAAEVAGLLSAVASYRQSTVTPA